MLLLLVGSRIFDRNYEEIVYYKQIKIGRFAASIAQKILTRQTILYEYNYTGHTHMGIRLK